MCLMSSVSVIRILVKVCPLPGSPTHGFSPPSVGLCPAVGVSTDERSEKSKKSVGKGLIDSA